MKQPIFRSMYPRPDHNEEEYAGLQRYIGSHQSDYHFEKRNHPKNLHSEQLHMQINRINSKLETICQDRLGDLTNSTSPSQIQKTLQLVETLLSEIKKLQQAKAKLINQRRQTEQSLLQNEQTIDKLARDKKNVENQKQTINLNLKNIEKAYKQYMVKSQSEKDQLIKQSKQFMNREKTFEAQFRKKQKFIKELQEGLKKFQDKDKSTFKNSFDVLQKLQFGPSIYDMYSTNGQNQYGRLAKDAKDEVFRKLSDENQYLKDCLANVYKQLNTVLELKRETLRNKRGYDGEYENCFELNCFRPQTLNLPEQWSRDRLKQLNQNIQRFKQAIKIGDYSQSRVDDRKEGCVNGIKQLIKSYKQVVETQDQLLNKVLLKSKEFKATQMAQLQNRFSKTLDSNQLDRAKRFVDEQAQYLQSKNMELEKTRKIMQMAMKKAQDSKRQMLKQRQAFQEQALEMRRSVEILPAVIQEELNKALN